MGTGPGGADRSPSPAEFGRWGRWRAPLTPARPVPALPLVAGAAVSVQFGAALAIRLFHRVGPVGAVTLRLVLAAVVLAAVGRWRSVRSASRADLGVAVAFGLILAAMNLSFYEAASRIPLGVCVTVEFSGPLTLALVGSRRWSDGLWAAMAAAGVALLATGAGHGLDPVGIGLAGVAGAAWIGYILLSKQTGRRFDTRTGLAVAMVTAAVAVLPAGLAVDGPRLVRPAALLLGAAVAVLSSVIPYSLELVALRGVTPRAFGVMLSLDPAVATAAGWAVLGQHLTPREAAALVLVVLANLGNALAGRPGPVVATAP
jgi:inner membrane transporter RhtA